MFITCVGAEVSFEVGALGVGLAAAGVFTAVDGGPLFPCGPPTALPFHPSRGQLGSNQQGLLVKGQMTRGLAGDVFTEKACVVIKVGHVAVVSGIRGDEPAVGICHRGGMLLGIVGVKVP